jgi:hypothetical protein
VALAVGVEPELAVVDVVADQLVEGPSGERFVLGFVGQQVVRTQVLKPVGQFQRALCCGRFKVPFSA